MSKWDDAWIGVLIALFAAGGFLFGFRLAHWPAEDMQRECEAALPRNQKCVMQFVPEDQ